MPPKVVLACARSFRQRGVAQRLLATTAERGEGRRESKQVIQREYTMHKKALTVAIAGALAAPMVAQAVDFTISGHVNRALVVVDRDDDRATPDMDEGSTKAQVKDNGSSGTRIRWTGSSEMMDGNSVGIQVEYGAGSSLSLRHANIHYAGAFGKITIGQGSEAGDGSAYRGGVGTFGVGHGQEKGSGMLGDYFGSLDAGTRGEMIRYDTPALGPVGAAVSVGNDDRISLAATLSTEFSGSSFNAMIASLREDSKVMGKAQETVGASFGVSMANGLGISGAWARGDNHGSKAATAAMVGYACFTDAAADGVPAGTIVDPVADAGNTNTDAGGTCPTGSTYEYGMTKAASMETMGTDPSFFQAAIAYAFGDTTVSASWYSSEDFMMKGSEGTAIGVGVNHNLPKVGAQVYAAAQNYDVTKMTGAQSTDETVFVVGTRVKF